MLGCRGGPFLDCFFSVLCSPKSCSVWKSCLPALACIYENSISLIQKLAFTPKKFTGPDSCNNWLDISWSWLDWVLTIFHSVFMPCLVVGRVWIQGLIIDTGFIEQLLRKKNPFFIIFMHSIPISEVGSGDANSCVRYYYSSICSFWRCLLTSLVSVGQLETHDLFKILLLLQFLPCLGRAVGWGMCLWVCGRVWGRVLYWKETLSTSWEIMTCHTRACLKKLGV